MISEKTIEDVVARIYSDAVINLNEDVKIALKEAYEKEDNKFGLLNLEAIIKNIELAEKNDIPMCQDTGLPVIFIKLGDVKVENLYQGIINGVKKATADVPLRPNVVDPITRKNTSDNTGIKVPIIDIELVDTNNIEITIMPKGFGSENNNALKMALPAEGNQGIIDFVIETVEKAGGKPCPPMIVGVGVGGTSDSAMKLAKKALIEPVGERNPDKTISKMEEELIEKINKKGVGPMGMGGKTTVLDVKIKTMSTHTAGLPIGVCIQCWAARHKTAIIYDE